MKKSLSIAIIFLCAGLMSGCSSIMVFQKAKTVDKGAFETGVGAAAGSYSSRRTIANMDLTMPSWAGNIWMRYGLLNNWDTGLNMAIPGNLTADTKVMFLNEANGAPITLSGGFAYGFSFGDAADSADSVQKITDYIVPLYVSKDIVDWLTLYVSPRYFYRRTYNEVRHNGTLTDAETIYDNMWGVGAGISFNITDKNRFMLECQKTAPFKDGSFSSIQCGAGLALGWGGSK